MEEKQGRQEDSHVTFFEHKTDNIEYTYSNCRRQVVLIAKIIKR